MVLIGCYVCLINWACRGYFVCNSWGVEFLEILLAHFWNFWTLNKMQTSWIIILMCLWTCQRWSIWIRSFDVFIMKTKYMKQECWTQVMLYMISELEVLMFADFCWCQVLFVCTANLVENIPGPLLDRMEVISLVGYITDEKVHIARGYLEKAARDDSGVKPDQVPHSIPLPAVVFVAHCECLGMWDGGCNLANGL